MFEVTVAGNVLTVTTGINAAAFKRLHADGVCELRNPETNKIEFAVTLKEGKEATVTKGSLGANAVLDGELAAILVSDKCKNAKSFKSVYGEALRLASHACPRIAGGLSTVEAEIDALFAEPAAPEVVDLETAEDDTVDGQDTVAE